MARITDYAAITAPQPDDVLLAVDIHDTSMDPSGTTKKMLLNRVLTAALIGPANGSDDTSYIQGLLTAARTAGGGIVTGLPGQSYKLSAPLRIGSHTTLDMTGCTVTLLAGSNSNVVQTWAVQANRRILDGVTNSTTTFTSATAVFTSGDTGSSIRIYYTDGTWLDTTITFVNSTTVTLAATATQNGTGLFAVIGTGRDADVRVTGGTWVRASGNSGNTYAYHNFRMRHVDGLRLGPLGGSSVDGMYFVSVADATRVHIQDVAPSATSRDIVHITGPANDVVIMRVSCPAPGDDLVAMNCGDVGAVADCMGNVTGVLVEDAEVPVPPATSPVALKIQAGSSTTGNGYLVDRITGRNIRSAILNDYPVNISDDPGSSFTQGGTWGTIIIDGAANINPASTYPAVNVIQHGTGVVRDLYVRSAECANPAATSLVNVQTNTTVTRLTTDCDRAKVNLVGGCKVATWISKARPADTPRAQLAVAYFEGTSIQATAPDIAALDITGALTVEFWVNLASAQVGFWTPVSKNNQYWFEGDSTGALKCLFTVRSSSVAYSSGQTPVLKAGRLNYICGTYDGAGHVAIYANGSQSSSIATAATTVDTSTNLLYIGNRQGFSRYTKGQIADVRVWNGLLTSADISAHYADPGNLSTFSTATLAGRWKCNEGTGTTLNDSSGNQNNATLTTGTWNYPGSPYLVQPQLSTGASHTVDDVIGALQGIGLFVQ